MSGKESPTGENDGALRSRTLLLVAYDFPPINSAGMHRVTSMAKYLTAAGWKVTVVTVGASSVHTSQQLLKYIPDGVRTVRTANFEWMRFKRFVRERLLGKKARGAGGDLGDVEGLFGADSPGGSGRRGTRSMFRRFEKLLMFPDKKVGWIIPLLVSASWLIARHRYDVVLSTSPPHSTHLPMLILKRLLRFRWVVDFRDPWTTPERDRRDGVLFRTARKLEERVLTAADAIIANTPGNKEMLVRTFQHIPPGTISVITNGLDRDRLKEATPAKTHDSSADLLFLGSLYPGMLDVYVAAIGHMLAGGMSTAPRLAAYGRIPEHARLDPLLRRYIEFKGRVPYDDSLGIIMSARALLLLLPHGPGYETWVPSKLYTYLFAEAPILALIPEGDAADFIRRTGRGTVVSDTDPRVVAGQIQEFLASTRDDRGRYRGEAAALDAFSWSALSKDLLRVLDETARKR